MNSIVVTIIIVITLVLLIASKYNVSVPFNKGKYVSSVLFYYNATCYQINCYVSVFFNKRKNKVSDVLFPHDCQGH